MPKLLLIFWLLISQTAFAADYTVELLTNDDQAIKVADLTLTPNGDEFQYQLKMLVDEPFGEFFLSMRPFRCLTESALQLNLCYLNYPYENKHTISQESLTDLEYDLLFIRRKSTDYGIDPWFGSYYKLSWQGDNIYGELHEVDLDILISPPEDGNLRPITEADLNVSDPSNFWLPKLRIIAN